MARKNASECKIVNDVTVKSRDTSIYQTKPTGVVYTRTPLKVKS